MLNRAKQLLLIILWFLTLKVVYANAVTLNELLDQTKKHYNPLQIQKNVKEAQRLRYKASYDPFYPSIDYFLNYQKIYHSDLSPSSEKQETYSGGFSLSYRILDLKRYYVKNSQNFSFLVEENNYAIVEKEMTKLVKDLYYKAVSQKNILESRKSAYKTASKTYDLTSARREVGVAKLSDVYQSKVRMENARLAVVSSQNELKKLIEEISSISGMALSETDFSENLSAFPLKLNIDNLTKIAIENRDELKKEENLVKKIEQEQKSAFADFMPTATASLSNRRTDEKFYPNKEENRLDITFNWNLFSGPGKFFKYSASKKDVQAQKLKLDESKRVIALEIKKIYEDINTAFEKTKVSEELVKSAQLTYDQAYEEYRVGKGDILSLLQAEQNLSNAREEKISSILALFLSKNGLERMAGISSIEGLKE